MTDADGPREPEWWTFLPPEERDLYRRSGYATDAEITGTAALLVIDVTLGFTGTRPMPMAEAVEEFPTSCGEAAWAALPNIARLLKTARASGIPVVYTGRDPEGQQAVGQTATKRRANVAAEGGNEINPMVAPADGEWICRKARASAFYGTVLEPYLRRRGVDTLIVTGTTTCGCVRATTVDAYSAGYNVFVAEDACFDRTRTQHLVNLFDMNAKYATVLPTETIVAALRAARVETSA